MASRAGRSAPSRTDDQRIADALALLSQATAVPERRAVDDPPWLMAYRDGHGAVTVSCGGKAPRAARRVRTAVSGLCDAVGLPSLYSALYVERVTERILRVWNDDNAEILMLVDGVGTFYLADWIEDMIDLRDELDRLFGPGPRR